MSKTYSEKLRDPKWQKKRLTVLDRDEWKCQMCLDDKSTLHVHHLYYESNKEPWEYPDESLITLCESCHADETECMSAIYHDFILILRRSGLMAAGIKEIATAFIHMETTLERGERAVYIKQILLRLDEFVEIIKQESK